MNPSSKCILIIIEERFWRRLGQRAYPAFPTARHTDPQPGVMVWGAISFDSRTSLVVIRAMFLKQDIARPYMARVTMNYLRACQTLSWPARSPDLCPIEHVWDMRGRRLRLPRNVDDLIQQLE
ncbi:transposable element Tc1 transposase [Trichonephila clavipes]|nr:transposable element Tc1 transposase [Trichonephila clavipes]